MKFNQTAGAEIVYDREIQAWVFRHDDIMRIKDNEYIKELMSSGIVSCWFTVYCIKLQL